MAKSLLKKAKKAAKSVKKTVKKEVKSASSSAKSKVKDIRAHVEKLAEERRDCATIHNLLKDTAKYKTDADIISLIKAKGYETLLGEVS
tara:strand:- start:443 stop:709 length:267 start_codon:yes stop_codon:yes gene_type:complete